MSAADLAAVTVSVLALVVSAVLVLTVSSLLRTVRTLRRTMEELEHRTGPLVDQLRSTVEDASVELDRVDELVGTAEAISARVDGASRLATAALSKPVIKTVAVATGTSRAARRLRQRP